MVEFRSMNLARALPPTSTMDVIFVRNVLMYFDVPTKRQVLTSLDFRLACDGYLFLGAAETLVDVHEGFVRTTDDRSCCYMLKPAT